MMQSLVALSVGLVLLAIAMVHFLWALGVIWPFKTEHALADAVVGNPKLTKMPSKLLTMIVALLIAAVAWLALSFRFPEFLPVPIFWIKSAAGVCGLVFLARMAISYLGDGPLGARTPIFKRLDQMIYAPLCGLLSLGFFYLIIV